MSVKITGRNRLLYPAILRSVGRRTVLTRDGLLSKSKVMPTSVEETQSVRRKSNRGYQSRAQVSQRVETEPQTQQAQVVQHKDFENSKMLVPAYMYLIIVHATTRMAGP